MFSVLCFSDLTADSAQRLLVCQVWGFSSNLVTTSMFARIYTLPVAVETPRILQAHWTAVHHTLSQFPMTPNTSVRQWVRMQHFTASKNNLKYMWPRQNWSEIIDRNTVSCQLWKVKKKTKSGYPAVTWCRGRRVQHKNVCEGMRLVAPITANLSHALTQTHAQRHTHTLVSASTTFHCLCQGEMTQLKVRLNITRVITAG